MENKYLTSIQDPTIKFKVSPNLYDFIKKHFSSNENFPQNITTLKLHEHANDVFLTMLDIQWLYDNINKNEEAKCNKYLHEVLQGCELILPKPEEIPRNPELEARVQTLKNEQAARSYRAMTRNVNIYSMGTASHTDSIAYQIKIMNKQLIAVFQFIISVVAGFAFGFIGINLMVGGDLEVGFRLLLGIICALIIALAEIYFLAKKLSEDPTDTDVPVPSIRKEHQE